MNFTVKGKHFAAPAASDQFQFVKGRAKITLSVASVARPTIATDSPTVTPTEGPDKVPASTRSSLRLLALSGMGLAGRVTAAVRGRVPTDPPPV
jgi:hypothetical protein